MKLQYNEEYQCIREKKKKRERERVTMGKKERKRKVNYLHA